MKLFHRVVLRKETNICFTLKNCGSQCIPAFVPHEGEELYEPPLEGVVVVLSATLCTCSTYSVANIPIMVFQS